MKKILFVVYGLGIGGVEKCLVNLVNRLSPPKYEITIAIMNPEYDFLEQIDPSVRIISFEDNFINTSDTLGCIRQSPTISSAAELGFRYLLYRAAVKLQFYPWKVQRWIEEEYDYAIAYTHVGYVPNYVIDRTKAKTKVLWYHTLFIDPKNGPYYRKFDRIVAVSQYCRENFIKTYPELKDKVSVLYNFYNFSEIDQKSEVPIEDLSFDTEKIVTVGRLSPEKGFELAIRAAAILKDRSGGRIHWYWVGDGPDPYKTQAKQLIFALGLKDHFHLLGNRINPYPYIKNCDIYVQPSEREAYSTTIIEAKRLRKPIVVTDIGSIYEQVTDNVNAFIVPHTPHSLAEKILLLYRNPEIKLHFSEKSMDGSEYLFQQEKAYDAFFNS